MAQSTDGQLICLRNGALKEYIGPDISKDEFRSRLRAALESETIPSSVLQAQGNGTPEVSASPAAPAPVPQAQPKAQSGASKPAQQQTSQAAMKKQNQPAKASSKDVKTAGPARSTSQSRPAPKDMNKDKGKAPMGTKKPIDKTTGKNAISNEQQEPKPVVPRGPPTQYRLQVRLFDGRSVRSSFTPTQSIKNDVRPWLDQQMEDDNRPYSLKQIRNPLPSETLSVSQESQTLRDLGIGSTANLVMIPVSTYTEAYSAAGSLPARGFSAVYNMASSAATTATGLVGSFLGYGSTTPAADPTPSTPESASTTQRPRQSGPNIRTLRDQQDGRGNSQLYNGNQVCSLHKM
jgi:hypothetical protein